MTVLRLERLAAGLLDDVLARLGATLLARSGGALFLTVADAEQGRAERLLAHAGIRALATAVSPTPPPALIGASGRSLVPVLPVAYDSVMVRSVPLGMAACTQLIGGWGWHRRAQRRARCRALLAGDEAAYLWSRQAWASAAVLRDSSARGALRPMVFVRATRDPSAPSRLGYATEGALERWAFPPVRERATATPGRESSRPKAASPWASDE